MKIICCLGIVLYVSIIIHFIIEIWQEFPLKEESSTPLYITKELKL